MKKYIFAETERVGHLELQREHFGPGPKLSSTALVQCSSCAPSSNLSSTLLCPEIFQKFPGLARALPIPALVPCSSSACLALVPVLV